MTNNYRITITLERQMHDGDQRDAAWFAEECRRYLLDNNQLPPYGVFSSCEKVVTDMLLAHWKATTPNWHEQLTEAIYREKRGGR